jgi:hypothetical protein
MGKFDKPKPGLEDEDEDDGPWYDEENEEECIGVCSKCRRKVRQSVE